MLWTPVSGQGGFIVTLTQKSTFPNEFCDEMRTDKVTKRTKINQIIRNSDTQLQNGGQNLNSNPRHKNVHQKWGNNFPERIFPKNLTHNWKL